MEPVAAVDFVSEGGDRIVNGQGTMLVSRTVERARNPGAAHTGLDRGYREALGVTNVIRLDSGPGVDLHSTWGPIPYRDEAGDTILLYGPQTTGGHLDELVRFAGPREIILAQATPEEAARDPLAALHYACCTAIARTLRQATDQRGNPFAVVQLPVPEVEYRALEPGEPMYQWLAELDYSADVPAFPHGSPIHVVKAASYANYLVTNGLVIAPGYGHAEKDDAVAATLEAAYPGRTVLQIDPSAINFAGGGIHCCTAEQPAGVAGHPEGGAIALEHRGCAAVARAGERSRGDDPDGDHHNEQGGEGVDFGAHAEADLGEDDHRQGARTGPATKLAMMRSSSDSVKESSQPDTSAGAITGTVMTRNTFAGRAPRSSAASSSDGSRFASCA